MPMEGGFAQKYLFQASGIYISLFSERVGIPQFDSYERVEEYVILNCKEINP